MACNLQSQSSCMSQSSQRIQDSLMSNSSKQKRECKCANAFEDCVHPYLQMTHTMTRVSGAAPPVLVRLVSFSRNHHEAARPEA